jgi:hypothetical protein
LLNASNNQFSHIGQIGCFKIIIRESGDLCTPVVPVTREVGQEDSKTNLGNKVRSCLKHKINRLFSGISTFMALNR